MADTLSSWTSPCATFSSGCTRNQAASREAMVSSSSAPSRIWNHRTPGIPVWKPDSQTWARRRVVSVPEYPDGPSRWRPYIFRIDLPSSSQAGPTVSAEPACVGRARRSGLSPATESGLPLAHGRERLPASSRRADGKGKYWGPSARPFALRPTDRKTTGSPTPSLTVVPSSGRSSRIGSEGKGSLVKAGEVRYVEGRFMPGWKRG